VTTSADLAIDSASALLRLRREQDAGLAASPGAPLQHAVG